MSKKADRNHEAEVDDVRKGRRFVQITGLPEPQDHTRDYDRVLKMLDMSVDATIELMEHDFQRYVMDDWEWTQQFTTSNAFYANGGKRRHGK